MVVSFEINGQEFTALNGGPQFKISEAVSFQVMCESQDEVDYYWEKLSQGGDPKAQACGWLKDKFGVSWQIIPIAFLELLKGPDAARAAGDESHVQHEEARPAGTAKGGRPKIISKTFSRRVDFNSFRSTN